MKYYFSTRSLLIQNPETRKDVTFPLGDPAFTVAKKLIRNGELDKLKFFTDVGYKLHFGEDLIIESTPTASFNIYYKGETYSTLGSMWDMILKEIDHFLIHGVFYMEDIITEIRGIDISLSLFNHINPEKLTVDTEYIKVKGTFGNYVIKIATNSVFLNGNYVCIHAKEKKISYTRNEKEAVLLIKALWCLNDNICFRKDKILRGIANQYDLSRKGAKDNRYFR